MNPCQRAGRANRRERFAPMENEPEPLAGVTSTIRALSARGLVAPSMGQCNSHGARLQWRASGVLVLLPGWVCPGPQARAAITITIKGVSDPLRSNVLAYLSLARYQRSKHLAPDTVDRLES